MGITTYSALILRLVVWLPMVAAILIGVVWASKLGEKWAQHWARLLALLASTASLLLMLYLTTCYLPSAEGPQFYESYDWLRYFKVSYSTGVDGLNLGLLTFTSLLFVLVYIGFDRPRFMATDSGYFCLMSILQTALLGLFASQDFFLTVTFLGLSLVPIYLLLILFRSGQKSKTNEQTAARFFLIQLVSCLVVFLAAAILATSQEVVSLNFIDLKNYDLSTVVVSWWPGRAVGGARLANIIFVLVLLAAIIRAALVPFHIWLVELVEEAPKGLAIIVSVLFTATGLYLLTRVAFVIAPHAITTFSGELRFLGILSILFAGVTAVTRSDLRSAVVYVIISQFGFVLLGLGLVNTASLQGALLELISVTIVAAGLLFVSFILGKRFRSYEYLNYSNVVFEMPLATTFLLSIMLSLIGVPGVGGFSAKALVVLGAFQSIPLARPLVGVITIFGLTLPVILFIRIFSAAFLRKRNDQVASIESLRDLNWREMVYLIPVLVLCVWLGSYPRLFLRLSENHVIEVLTKVGR